MAMFFRLSLRAPAPLDEYESRGMETREQAAQETRTAKSNQRKTYFNGARAANKKDPEM
jgi:hypothetical protein